MREQITVHNFANTGPVINWLELPNSGERLLTLASAINTPATAAAIVIKSYKAKENDELSLTFGDLISVIDMPSANESIWGRAKKGFDVGFFPTECVKLIGEGSNFINPNSLKQLLLKQPQCTGSLRFKQQPDSTNNENENPLVYLLKYQLTDDEKLSAVRLDETDASNSKSAAASAGNYRGESASKNDKKPLIECQTANSMNSKQHCTTPRINLRSISPLLNNTDHQHRHTPNTPRALLKPASGNSHPAASSSSVFQRRNRNRISSTLPKSLASANGSKPACVCVNLFSNLDNLDTPEKSCNGSPDHHSSAQPGNPGNSVASPPSSLQSSPINASNGTNGTNGNQMMGNKRNKLSNFLRSIINRNNSSPTEFDKRNSPLKRNEKSNSVLINLRKNKKLLIENTVFGAELNDYLDRTGRRTPLVLESCCDFLEKNGVVHGVYRLSGVSSNIQKLIKCFNADEEPDFSDDIFLQDVHCVSSLLKLYFRELPQPLLTFELYESFVKAIQPSYDPTGLTAQVDELPEKTKLSNLIKVLKQLPANHYVTLEYLARHLNKIASYSDQTGMTIKNLAIVWSPNLLRSRELELNGGIGALQGIAIQAILTEYLIRYVDDLFTAESRPFNYLNEQTQEDNPNGSFLSDNACNQLNSFSLKDPSNSIDQSKARETTSPADQFNDESNAAEECLETDEHFFSDGQASESENGAFENCKFPIRQDSNLITLSEAQSRWKQKCKALQDEDQTIDQLISSNFRRKDESGRFESNKEEQSFFGGPSLNFMNSAPSNRRQEADEFRSDGDSQPTFGVLGNFGSSRRKRFGNLGLPEGENEELLSDQPTIADKQSVRKRRSRCESEELDAQTDEPSCASLPEHKEPRNRFAIDRYRRRNFDEHSDEECKSDGSLRMNKSDRVDEPLQRYHTILNPQHFSRNKTSTPKESSSKRTPTKWKPLKL